MSNSDKSNTWEMQAREAMNRKTKPLGSLGHLEELAIQLARIQERLDPRVDKKRLCLFAASHGVALFHGVSAFPSVVTGQMVANFLVGGAAVNVLARAHHVELQIIDVGVDAEPFGVKRGDFFDRRIRRGTRDFLVESAMTTEECEQALEAGREQARLAQQDGVMILGIGEMGIGNTTSAATLCSALMNLPPAISVGRGTGVDEVGLQRKREVVKAGLAYHHNCHSALDWLAAVGGYEIAAMTGLILEASRLRLAVMVDGFIATAAAVVARRLLPETIEGCFFGHVSAEKAHATILPLLNVRPILSLGMCLGEGTGAVLAMTLVDSAARILREMASFESAGVSDKQG